MKPVRIQCTLPEHEQEWVEFGPISLAFRNRWFEKRSDPEAEALVAELIVDCHLLGVDGQPALLPPVGEKRQLPDTLPLELSGWLMVALRDEMDRRALLPFPSKSKSPAPPAD